MDNLKLSYNNFTQNKKNDFNPIFEISVKSQYHKNIIKNEFILNSIINNNFLFNSYLETSFYLSDENNVKWLKEELINNNFLISFRNENIYSANTVTGSGGIGLKDNKNKGCVWSIVGTKCPINEIGILKTNPHLLVHVIQTNFFINSDYNILNMPYWFIEGHADYSAIVSISKDYEDFLLNRKVFLTKCYVPENIKKEIKKWNNFEWIESFKKSEETRHMLEPASSELYSGFLLFEYLLKDLNKEDMLQLYKLSKEYKDFRKAFEKIHKTNIDIFYQNVSNLLIENAKEII
jgi:hypothetical protein